MQEIKKCLATAMEELQKNIPMEDVCPLADKEQRPKWKCGRFDRGNETFCKSISGYSKCPHYIKWFHWNIWRMTAKEIAKTEIDLKKKEAKKK